MKPDVQGDLVKIAHPVAESAQIHDSGDWVSNAPGKAWKKPVSDAIGSAKLGPQSALAGHMGQRTNACQEDGFDEGEMERERFKWVPLPESLPPPPSLDDEVWSDTARFYLIDIGGRGKPRLARTLGWRVRRQVCCSHV